MVDFIGPLTGKDSADEDGSSSVSIHGGKPAEVVRCGQISRVVEMIEKEDRAEVIKRVHDGKALKEFHPFCGACFFKEANAGVVGEDSKMDDYRLLELQELKVTNRNVVSIDGMAASRPCGYEVVFTCPMRGCKKGFMINYGEEALERQDDKETINL